MAGVEEQALAFDGCRDMDCAAVVCIGDFADQAPGFEGVRDARHGWRADLFRVGKLAEREGAGKHDDRERREARGIQAAGRVGAPQLAEEIDGGCMQSFGGLFRIETFCS